MSNWTAWSSVILAAALVAATPARADDVEDCGGKDRERSIRGCTALIAAGGQFAQLGYRIRALQYLAKGDYRRALADFDVAIRQMPGRAESYSGRGVAHLNLKNYRAALADFDTALKLKPGEAIALRHRPAALAALKAASPPQTSAGSEAPPRGDDTRTVAAFLTEMGWVDADWTARLSKATASGEHYERSFKKVDGCNYKLDYRRYNGKELLFRTEISYDLSKLVRYSLSEHNLDKSLFGGASVAGVTFSGKGFYCMDIYETEDEFARHCRNETTVESVRDSAADTAGLPGFEPRTEGEFSFMMRRPNADGMKRLEKIIRDRICKAKS